ncbi:hypothetical protein CHS0354_029076 [Potamilus streckersoni]|uniref:Uncharacterized protein n=1 Tax=Potamilus streckersoni TaxID=2493646 RepID=A0AAE0SRX1_9BIVA|nr:hypothetical protein CHS0354_029076 [Potamilus streckersoni]
MFCQMEDLRQHVMQMHPKMVDEIPSDFSEEGNSADPSSEECSAAVQAKVGLLFVKLMKPLPCLSMLKPCRKNMIRVPHPTCLHTFLPYLDDVECLKALTHSPSRPEVGRKLYHTTRNAKESVLQIFNHINHEWFNVEFQYQDKGDT